MLVVARFLAAILAFIAGPATTTPTPAVRLGVTRTVLVGDSEVWDMCGQRPNVMCAAFPGVGTSDQAGNDLFAQMLDAANLHPGDTAIVSVIGNCWTGSDMLCAARLINDYKRLLATGATVTILVPPTDGFPACAHPTADSPIGLDVAKPCATMQLMADVARDTGAPVVPLDGDTFDGIHLTPAAIETLLTQIGVPA